jgi:hypothetical protein
MRIAALAFFFLLAPFAFSESGSGPAACVEQGAKTLCFGADDSAGDLDWYVETIAQSGRIRRYTERLPYDQEARRIAVSIDSGWIVYIVHSRWLEEFSTVLETRWEIVLFDANGSLRKRLDLPGKPDGLFDLGGYLFLSFPDGSHRTYDGNLMGREGLPEDVALTLGESMAFRDDAVWLTPSGEQDEFGGIGHYKLEYHGQDGVLILNVTVIPTMTGLEEGLAHPGRIVFVSDAPVMVDSDPPVLNGTIDAPGIHRIVVFGKNGYRVEWTVLLKPDLFGLPDAATVRTVRLYSNASILVNAEPYAPGTPIERAGTYEVTLLGTGGYWETHSFVIASNAAGVEDGGVYDAPWTFFVNGTGLLNGEAVSGEVTIRSGGDYELAFWDDPKNPRFVRFRIESRTLETRVFDPMALMQIGLAILALLGLYFIRKRK